MRKYKNALVALNRKLEYAVFTKNPMLVQGLSITPVVAVAYNVKTAIALGAVLAALLLPLEVLSSLLLRRIPAPIRAALYFTYGICAVALLTPLITSTYRGVGITLGVYLPLMAVNSLLYSRCETYAVRHSVKKSVLDGLVFTLGASILMILSGVIRELLGSGTLYGIPLGIPKLIPSMTYPFAGFLLLGFFGVLFRGHTALAEEETVATREHREEESPHD